MLTQCKAGADLMFDFARQAWFPDVGMAELSAEFPARARLLSDVSFDATIGMRSSDIPFKVFERYEAPAPLAAGDHQ